MIDHPHIINASAEINLLSAWRADLAARVARRRLAFELIDCTVPFDDLIEEWEQWKRIKSAVEWLDKSDVATSTEEDA